MRFAQSASSTNKLLIHLSILDENQENEVFTDKFAFDIVIAEANAPNPPLNYYFEKAVATFGKPVELVKARYLNIFWNEQVYANVQEEPILGDEYGIQYFATYKDHQPGRAFPSALLQTHLQINLPARHLSPLLLSAAHQALAAPPSNLEILKKLLQKLQNTSKPAPTQAKPSIPSSKPEQSTAKAPTPSTKPTPKASPSKTIVICLVIDVAQYAGRYFTSMYRYEQNFLFEIEPKEFEKLKKFAKKAVKIWGQKEYERLELVSCGKFDAFYKEYLHVDKMLDAKVQNGSKYMINFFVGLNKY